MRIFVVILGLMATLVLPASATARCADMTQPVTVNFKPNPGTVRLNHRLNITGISNLMANRGLAMRGAHTRSLGITYLESQLAFSLKTQVRANRDGSHCVALDSVDVDFGFDKLEVYIAREFALGSCQYNAILDHENEHVAINRAVLSEYAPRIRAELDRAVARLKPVHVAQARDGVDRLGAQLDQALSRSVRAFHAERDARNARIDTNSNYAALAELCPVWVR